MDIRLSSASDGVEAAIDIYGKLGIRCIFSSGHADAHVRRSAERAHPLGWLDKPYTSAQLLDAVKDAVEHLESRPSVAEAALADRDRNRDSLM
jgi:two-component system, response regulator PdtaR